MSYEDLPDNWHTLPLTDPTHTADVLDLYVSMRSRFTGALIVVVCDEQQRPLQPIEIEQTESQPSAADEGALAGMARTIGGRPGLSVLCALARRGRLGITAGDKAWLNTVTRAFAGHADLLGFYVATPAGLLRADPMAQAA